MGDRDDEQDQSLEDHEQRIEDLETADSDQGATDDEQDRRLDDLEDGQTQGGQHDVGQDKRLDAIEREAAEDGIDAELPGINTPEGAQQRIKLKAPKPYTEMTLGAIGNADAAQHKFGDGGFSFKTDESFAAEIKKHTFIDSDQNIVFHTPVDLTGVTGKKMNFSTNGDYQLGTVGGLAITAAPGAGFEDPAFTVDPAMPIPDPPAIDTGGPRSTVESVKTGWGIATKAYDAYSGVNSLKGIAKDGFAKGFAKDKVYGKAAGIYSLYSNSRKLYVAGKMLWDGAVAAFNHFNPPEKKAGPGKPKVTIYAEDGVSVMSPSKVSLFSSKDGISIESPHKVGIKAGISASMKAGCEATVWGFVSAKLDSKGLTAVKGKVVSVSADETEVIGKKAVHISSNDKVGIVSDASAQVSAKGQIDIGARGVTVAGSSTVDILSDLNVDIWSKTKLEMKVGKELIAKSGETIELKVKGTGFDCKDGEFRFGCDDKVGVRATSSQANIGTQRTYAVYKDASLKITSGGPATINGKTIKLG